MIQPKSYEFDHLRDFGNYFRDRLAVARDRLRRLEEKIAVDDALYLDCREDDPDQARIVAVRLAKNRELRHDWLNEVCMVLDDLDDLERRYGRSEV